jgi:hypothetical protein
MIYRVEELTLTLSKHKAVRVTLKENVLRLSKPGTVRTARLSLRGIDLLGLSKVSHASCGI